VTRRALLLAAAAAAYTVAAWSAAPGFYDGFGQAVPYRWVNPPPQFAKGNQPPAAGHDTIKIAAGGQSEPATATTDDPLTPQCLLSVTPGAFQTPPDRSPVVVDIKPLAAFPPPPPGIKFLTNVYLLTASQPLAKDAIVSLSFSDGQPAPSAIYRAEQSGGSWTDIGSTGASAPWSISVKTGKLGYFAAGYDTAKGAAGPRLGGGQVLPIITALAIVIVVIAGLPLALMRRRREAPDAGDEGPRPPSDRPPSAPG
jgi:hypothetical protein